MYLRHRLSLAKGLILLQLAFAPGSTPKHQANNTWCIRHCTVRERISRDGKRSERRTTSKYTVYALRLYSIVHTMYIRAAVRLGSLFAHSLLM